MGEGTCECLMVDTQSECKMLSVLSLSGRINRFLTLRGAAWGRKRNGQCTAGDTGRIG